MRITWVIPKQVLHNWIQNKWLISSTKLIIYKILFLVWTQIPKNIWRFNVFRISWVEKSQSLITVYISRNKRNNFPKIRCSSPQLINALPDRYVKIKVTSNQIQNDYHNYGLQFIIYLLFLDHFVFFFL